MENGEKNFSPDHALNGELLSTDQFPQQFSYLSCRRQFLNFLLTIGALACTDSTAQAKPPTHETFSGGTKLSIAHPDYNACQGYDWKNEDLQKIRRDCDFWDPKEKGNLLRIRKKDLGKPLSSHFKVKEIAQIDPDYIEYAKQGTYFKVKTPAGYEYYWKLIRIDRKLLKLLERIRKKAGGIVKIDEGYRPYGFNVASYLADCGNAPDLENCVKEKSFHVSGQAVDLERTDKILNAAKKIQKNNGGLGIGPHVIHVDSRRDKALWFYGNQSRRR